MRDANGNVLKIGDTVLIPCRVEHVGETPDYGNARLTTLLGRSPDHQRETIHLNTRQMLRAEDQGVDVIVREDGVKAYLSPVKDRVLGGYADPQAAQAEAPAGIAAGGEAADVHVSASSEAPGVVVGSETKAA